jgi:hypothetical protein
MANNRRIRIEIQKMSIDNVNRILYKKYKIAPRKLHSYPEDIKRDLLFDLETHLSFM